MSSSERRRGFTRRTLLQALAALPAALGFPAVWAATQVAGSVSELTGDVSAELKVVLCDDHGKMLSIVTGRATVSAPRGKVRIAELREQALTEAVGGLTHSLQSQLARAAS